MLALVSAIAVSISTQDQSKVVNDLAREAAAKGLVLSANVPRLAASEDESSWTPARWRFLVNQEFAGAPWKVDCKVILIPDEKTREDMLRSYKVTQAAQFLMDNSALNGTGLKMFSYACPPSEAMGSSQLPIGIYGVAGHCIVSVQVSGRSVSDSAPKFTAKKVSEALVEIALNLAKEAAAVPDSGLSSSVPGLRP